MLTEHTLGVGPLSGDPAAFLAAAAEGCMNTGVIWDTGVPGVSARCPWAGMGAQAGGRHR